ncbi:MAG TPA: CARDB domain-containing protein, partial [Candidatus Methanoperedens sp.]|nr:hypothetical protein [Candidatus Methanoperedens sp.]HLB69741.1 CARDB domain-containing protein [Candidatus Methanoperedens sp.]
ESTGAMPGAVANVDTNLATSSPVCTNSFNGDSDASDAFFEFLRNVTSAMNTIDNQTYSACYTNDGASDAETGAKMNGILIYTYQWTGQSDLVMTQTNISFSYAASQTETGEVKENVNVTINATVYNNGSAIANIVKVSFYDGSPGSGNNIANTTIASIAAGASQNATVYWNSLAGTHNISVKVDPDNNITESDETNNNASKFINVSAWQKYYGNVSGNLKLKDQPGNSFKNWTWGSLSGNIFITNVTSLNFSKLQALGRNKSGGIAQNNFSRADVLLNLTPGSSNATGFINNNITQLFSTDGTNPRNTTSFTIYGNIINNVAIVNSTNVTNHTSVENATFITGILWDTTKDDGDGEYGDDSEDFVFISNINVGKTGTVPTSHDYDIAIPSNLKGSGMVYFYAELK